MVHFRMVSQTKLKPNNTGASSSRSVEMKATEFDRSIIEQRNITSEELYAKLPNYGFNNIPFQDHRGDETFTTKDIGPASPAPVRPNDISFQCNIPGVGGNLQPQGFRFSPHPGYEETLNSQAPVLCSPRDEVADQWPPSSLMKFMHDDLETGKDYVSLSYVGSSSEDPVVLDDASDSDDSESESSQSTRCK